MIKGQILVEAEHHHGGTFASTISLQEWMQRQSGIVLQTDGTNAISTLRSEQFYKGFNTNLLTTDGRDFFIDQCYVRTSSNSTSGSNFIALTTDTGAPAAGDTTLASEITTGGLGRAQATTITHTDNTNATTLAKTFTASATHTAVQKSGLFNIVTAGIMSHEATITPVTLVSSDTLTITWTTNLG